MTIVDLDDVQLFVTDSGEPENPQGPPLLLLHGWTCDSHDWVFQLDAFAAKHRVVAPDLRGHGRSSEPADGYTAQHYAADLAALLDRLDTGPVVAVGHSLGASVAAALAVEHPHLVRAMVVVEPAYGQYPANLAWLREVGGKFGDEDGSALAVQLMAATEPLAPEWLRTWHGRRTLGMRPDLLARTFHGMYGADEQISGQPATDAYLARRTCPTLAFHRLPDMAAWEAGLLGADGRVVTWEGGGHWLHQDRPVEFTTLVLEWVAALEPSVPEPV